MYVAVTHECFPAYARLPRKAQRSTEMLLRELTAEPRQWSIDLKPLEGARDRRLRLVPIGEDHRAVVWMADGGDAILLVWVDRADAARRWAASIEMDVDPSLLAAPGAPSHVSVATSAASAASATEAAPVLAPGTAAVANPRDPLGPPTRDASGFQLDSLRLPTRMLTFADRKGIGTLQALAQLAPRDLLAERNLGRRSIAGTRVVLEKLLGSTWEQLAGVPSPESEGQMPLALRPGTWDAIRVSLPEELRAMEVDQLDASARVRRYARGEGLPTVGDLAKRSQAELMAAKNFGQRSIRSLVEAVGFHLYPPEASASQAALGLLDSWKALLDEQDPFKSIVVVRRSGLGGPVEALHSIAESLRVPALNVRRREARILGRLARQTFWLSEVRRRFDQVLGDGAIPLDTLGKDPWWAPIVALPQALDYFGRRLLDGAVRVVDVGERSYLARSKQAEVDDAWKTLREVTSQVPTPKPLGEFKARVMQYATPLGSVLAAALWEQLLRLLLVDAVGGGRRVLAVLRARTESAIAILEASRRPVPLDALLARIGRVALPEQVLFLGPNLVGMERHFPDFAGWMDRLVPAAIAVMKRRARDRQWSVDELFEAISKKTELPPWLDEWHLGSLMRRSGRVRWLGRGRVALPGGPAGKPPLIFCDEVRRIVHELGKPITGSEIRHKLGKKTSFHEMGLRQILMAPHFLQCDAERVGLVERDLPGGLPARTLAADRLAAVIERRGRGLGDAQLRDEVTPLSRAHATWTKEMCLSILRGDPRFRISGARGAGLSIWESARVPTRGDLIRECLDESGGRARVEAVQRRMVEHFGEALDRGRIGMLANAMGAGLRGVWLERRRPRPG